MNKKQLETLIKNNEESRDFVRNCFRFALMILLKEKKGEKITVTKLCEIAGVSRMAFYRNYHDVDDVMVDQIKIFAENVAAEMGTDIYENWLALFSNAQEHREDLEAIVQAGFERKILEVFLSLAPKEEDNRTIQTIWLSLYYSLLIKWIREKKPKKAEDMARVAYTYTKGIPLVSK